ncbi:MAG: hypothetical protein M0Z95_02230 [Actinomycetota bacterium]|nr:hypothetical protein [Actinomycetota bacterium]
MTTPRGVGMESCTTERPNCRGEEQEREEDRAAVLPGPGSMMGLGWELRRRRRARVLELAALVAGPLLGSGLDPGLFSCAMTDEL